MNKFQVFLIFFLTFFITIIYAQQSNQNLNGQTPPNISAEDKISKKNDITIGNAENPDSLSNIVENEEKTPDQENAENPDSLSNIGENEEKTPNQENVENADSLSNIGENEEKTPGQENVKNANSLSNISENNLDTLNKNLNNGISEDEPKNQISNQPQNNLGNNNKSDNTVSKQRSRRKNDEPEEESPEQIRAKIMKQNEIAGLKSTEIERPECIIAEFRAIALDNGDPKTRQKLAREWLESRARQCSAEQLLAIRNNHPQWLGSADSAKLTGIVDGLLEKIAAENPLVAALLYGTPPVPLDEDENKSQAEMEE